MNRLDVTLIVLTYNDAPFIQEALASVKEWWLPFSPRVVILDNGSEDETSTVIAAWQETIAAGPEIAVEIHPSNLGPLGGLLWLLRRVSTQWACVLHGDDVLDPGFGLAAVTQAAQVPPNHVLFPMLRSFGQGVQGTRMQRPPSLNSRLACAAILDIYGAFPVGGALIPVQESIRVLEMHEGKFLCAEDWLLMHGLVSAGCVLRSLRGASYGYRLHAANTTHTDLQAFSVGFIRGELIQGPRWPHRILAASQVGREARKSSSRIAYAEGLQLGLKHDHQRARRLMLQGDWLALPGLALARLLKAYSGARTSMKRSRTGAVGCLRNTSRRNN